MAIKASADMFYSHHDIDKDQHCFVSKTTPPMAVYISDEDWQGAGQPTEMYMTLKIMEKK